MVSAVILNNLEEPAGPLHKVDMMVSYDEGRHVVHLRKKLGFEMCGQRVDAKTDVCIMERSRTTSMRYLLLVQEDKVRRPHLCTSKIC
jgi:hypothetical protein